MRHVLPNTATVQHSSAPQRPTDPSLPVLQQAHHLIMCQIGKSWCSAGMHWDLYTANNNIQSPYLGAGVPRLYNVDGATPASATVTDLPAQQNDKPVLINISDSEDSCSSPSHGTVSPPLSSRVTNAERGE